MRSCGSWFTASCNLWQIRSTKGLSRILGKCCFLHLAGGHSYCLYPKKNHLQKRYGLCKSPVPACRFLYYVPLLLLASGNLWNGIALNYSLPETICRIVCMLCVGFLEEVLFRGLLFAAIAKDNVKSAIVISSVTFGIGHIINLFNGSGMELVSNLCQIVFAIAVGFLLVTIFSRGGSLLPCILVHSAINTLWYICQRCWSDYGNALTASRFPDCNYGCLYTDPDKNAPGKSKENTQMMTLYKKSINDTSYNSYYHVVSPHLTLANDRADCHIIFHRWILKFFQQVLHHLTHTFAGSFFFLQVYYARITEFLRFQPSPLQRSIDTG